MLSYALLIMFTASTALCIYSEHKCRWVVGVYPDLMPNTPRPISPGMQRLVEQVETWRWSWLRNRVLRALRPGGRRDRYRNMKLGAMVMLGGMLPMMWWHAGELVAICAAYPGRAITLWGVATLGMLWMAVSSISHYDTDLHEAQRLGYEKSR